MISACTIVARNYLAYARVLAGSFFLHHKDGDFTVLLVDDEQRAADCSAEPFQCLRLVDIGLDRAEIDRLAARYDVTELSTAVKPRFLRHLMSESRDVLIYLDPDIRIYDSIAEAADLARKHTIVLTPHTLVPMPCDGLSIDEFQILAAGIYNLGFIAVGDRCEAFLDWWWNKTRREARSDPLRMMFTDQRWVDFVPGFFDHYILRDPAYNVAYWNLHGRHLDWNGERYLVDGQPLKFFHFSGFDPRRPHLLSRHQTKRPRILLSENGALKRICQDYATSLEQVGHAEESTLQYGWARLPSGLPFSRRLRRLYLEGLEAHEKGRGAEPPDPFDHDAGRAFLDWLNTPIAEGLHPRVSRYLHSVYTDRADLQNAFPDLRGDDCRRYFEWVRTSGAIEEDIPVELLPTQVVESNCSTYVSAQDLAFGANIVGHFRAEIGTGEAARLLTEAIDAADIPHSTIVLDTSFVSQRHPFVPKGDNRAPYDVNILCVNADSTPSFAKHVGSHFFEGRHTVGYWFWELDHFPATMHGAFESVDEVWTASAFVARGINAIGKRPVYSIPLPIPVPVCSPHITRKCLGLPASFMFLFMFDFLSIPERKNPIGLIRAFRRAFRDDEGPFLMMKTINGDSRLDELEEVRAAAGDRRDILIVDESYTCEKKNALIGLCDCYVSLHRSEGLGLTMGEAMALGKPVIATAYSGNLEFMTPHNSYLVDYTLGAVPGGCLPYPKGARWAEPNIDDAAECMRRVYEAPAKAARKARQARFDILTKHNVRAAASAVHTRLDEINKTRHYPAQEVPRAKTEEIPRPTILDGIRPLLTPISNAQPTGRFRAFRLAAKGILFRILQPYWWQQRAIQTALVESVTAALNTLAAQQETMTTLSTAARAFEAKRAEYDAALQAVRTAFHAEYEAAFQAVWTAVHAEHDAAFQAMSTAVHAEHDAAFQAMWTAVHALDARTSDTDRRYVADQRSIAAFQESAGAHLKALTDQHGADQLNIAMFQESAACHLRTLSDQLVAMTSQVTSLNVSSEARRAEHDATVESVWAAVHALDARTAEADRRCAAELTSIAAFQDSAGAHLKALTDQHSADQRNIAMFQQSASCHLQALSDQLVAMTSQVTSMNVASEARRAEHDATVESVWAAVHAMDARTVETDRRCVGELTSISAFQTSATTHLKAVTDQLAATTSRVSSLHERLYAIPYMSDPGRFEITDGRGQRVLGFQSRRDSDEEVYVGFEQVFRGSEPFIRDRFRAYLPLLQSKERVVEIGSGRGEVLDLLREAGVAAVGVDIDGDMVRRLRAKGHVAEHLDGNSYLRAQPDRSVPCIFAAQVVEHFAYEDIISFLRLSRAKLRPGGQLIFETVNPHALEAYKTFWADLTHQRPIFPEVSVVLCWLLGFDGAYVWFPNGQGDFDQDRRTQGEYAVVATKC